MRPQFKRKLEHHKIKQNIVWIFLITIFASAASSIYALNWKKEVKSTRTNEYRYNPDNSSNKWHTERERWIWWQKPFTIRAIQKREATKKKRWCWSLEMSLTENFNCNSAHLFFGLNRNRKMSWRENEARGFTWNWLACEKSLWLSLSATCIFHFEGFQFDLVNNGRFLMSGIAADGHSTSETFLLAIQTLAGFQATVVDWITCELSRNLHGFVFFSRPSFSVISSRFFKLKQLRSDQSIVTKTIPLFSIFFISNKNTVMKTEYIQ